MKVSEAMQRTLETVVPPSSAVLAQRLDDARRSLVAAQEGVQQADAAKVSIYGADDEQRTPKAIMEAEARCVQARLSLERAAGRVSALEARVAASQAEDARQALQAGRRKLEALKAERADAGAQILAALDQLQAAVNAFTATDEAIIALPATIRGTDAVPGHNLGASALRAHLAVELAQRDVLGQRSSMQTRTFAEWVDVGNRTLGST